MTTSNDPDEIRAEIERLESVEMPRIAEKIAQARAEGDLKENAEYHAAREQQSFIEGRIKELESHISNCEIIDVTSMPASKKVVFGATVELEDEDDGGKVVYQIVGEAEADIRAGLISITSPIARALVGKSEGDAADVAAPGGVRSYEIVSVRYV